MPITHFRSVFNVLDELTTVVETLIYYLRRFYLLVKGGEVRKLRSYSHFTGKALATVSVTEFCR